MNDGAVIAPAAPEARPRRVTWASAFLLATALHACAAAFAFVRGETPDLASEDVGGLVVVEFAPMPASADSQEESASPSDAAAVAAPSPEVEEKRSAASEDDTPTAESSPHEAPPDLQLAQQQTQQKQETQDDAQPTEANEATPTPPQSAAAAPSDAAALPSTQQDAVTQAATEGSAQKAEEAPASWQRKIVAHLGRHKRYPQEARSKHDEGEVAVRFRVDRTGKLISASVLRSSGSLLLDSAALDLLHRAQPLPAFPASVRANEVELVAPINYRLR